MAIQYIYPDTYDDTYNVNTYKGSITGNTYLLDSGGQPLGVYANYGRDYVDEGINYVTTDYVNYYYSGSVPTVYNNFSFSGELDVIPYKINHRFMLAFSGTSNIDVVYPYGILRPSISYTDPDIGVQEIFVASGIVRQDGAIIASFDENSYVPTNSTFSVTNNSGTPTLIDIEYYNFALSGYSALYPTGSTYASGLYYSERFYYTQTWSYNTTGFNKDFKLHNAEIIVSGEPAPKNKTLQLFLQNYESEPTGIPLVTFGKASDSGYLDFYMHANQTSYMNMVMVGKSSAPSGQSYLDFFLDAEVPLDAFGFQNFYLTNNSGGSGGINLYMYGRGLGSTGYEDYNNSIHFHTYAISGETSGSLDFNIIGGTASHIPLYINCSTIDSSGQVPFHMSSFSNSGIYGVYTMNLEGSNLKDAELNLYVGNSLNEEQTDNINLFMGGAYPTYTHNIDFTLKNTSSGFSGLVPLHIIGGPTDTSGNLSMYIARDYETTSNFFNMLISNSGYTNNLDMYLAGANKASTNIDFNILGVGENSGQVHLYINGY